MNAADLQKFCDDGTERRFGIGRPWSRGGYSYATDGHIIVRLPRLEDVPESSDAPDAEKLFAEALVTQWLPVPGCRMPAPIPCRWCDGTGRDPADRRYKCYDCRGTKTVPDELSALSIAGANFACRFLALIQGWEIAPNGQKAAWIRNGEAAGLLMPRRL